MVSVVEIVVLTLFSIMIIIFAVMGYKTYKGSKSQISDTELDNYLMKNAEYDSNSDSGLDSDSDSGSDRGRGLSNASSAYSGYIDDGASDASYGRRDSFWGGGFLRKHKKLRKFGVAGLLLITLLVVSFGSSSYSSIIKALNDL